MQPRTSSSSSSESSTDSGYFSGIDKSHSKNNRKYRKGRSTIPMTYTLSFDESVEAMPALKRLPRAILSFNPQLGSAASRLDHNAAQLSSFASSSSTPSLSWSQSSASSSQTSSDEDQMAETGGRKHRRGSAELRMEHFEPLHAQCPCSGDCLDCRLERALQFSGLGDEGQKIPDGLLAALARLQAADRE